MKLHEAIESVLIKEKGGLSIKEITQYLNDLDLYSRKDESQIPESQVLLRVKNYSKLFSLDDGLVSLKSLNEANNEKLIYETTSQVNQISVSSGVHRGMEVFLSLLFLKYIDLRNQQAAEIDGRNYIIPDSAKWENFRSNDFDLDRLIYNGLCDVESVNSLPEGILSGIIKDQLEFVMDLYASDYLSELIKLISQIRFDSFNGSFGKLFDTYLYAFLKLEERKGGEWVLSEKLSRLMLSFISKREKMRIYNPFAGLASFGVFAPTGAVYAGQELNSSILALGNLRLLAHDKLHNCSISAQDSISNWAANTSIPYDVIIAAPPFKAKINTKGSSQKLVESFIVEESIKSIANDGKVIVLVAASFLFNKGREGSLRNKLVSGDFVESVVLLPSGVISGTAISTAILVLAPSKEAKNSITLIDATNCLSDDRSKQRKIDFEAINELVISESDSDFRRRVSNEEIIASDYNLYPTRHLLVDVDLEKRENLAVLSEILSVVPKRNFDNNVKSRFVRIRDLSDDSINVIRSFSETDMVQTPSHAYILESQSLLVAARWKTLKPTFFTNSDDEVSYSNDLIALKVKTSDKVDIEYLIIELQKKYVTKQLDKYRTGNTISYLSKDDFLKIKLELPSLEVQKQQVSLTKSDLFKVEEEKLRILKKELGVDVDDENSFLRHQISGSLKNAREAYKSLRSIIETSVVSKIDNLYDLKKSPTSKLTFSNYLDIIERDLMSIHKSVQQTEDKLGFIDFNSEEIFIYDFVNDYCTEVNARKNNLFSISFYKDKEEEKVNDLRKVVVRGDKSLLRKLFDNLIDNAEKHAFDGSLSAKNNVDVQLMFDFEDFEVQIDFANTGKALPKDFTLQSFTRKGSKIGDNVGEGFGGWYINEIMKLHSGRVEFTDETEPGGLGDWATSFELYLPISIKE